MTKMKVLVALWWHRLCIDAVPAHVPIHVSPCPHPCPHPCPCPPVTLHVHPLTSPYMAMSLPVPILGCVPIYTHMSPFMSVSLVSLSMFPLSPSMSPHVYVPLCPSPRACPHPCPCFFRSPSMTMSPSMFVSHHVATHVIVPPCPHPLFLGDSGFPKIALHHSGLLDFLRPRCVVMDTCFHQTPLQHSSLPGNTRPCCTVIEPWWYSSLSSYLCPRKPILLKVEP